MEHGKNTAIVLAAGQGKRMGTDVQKQFLEIRGIPLVCYSLRCFEESPLIQEIILVTNEEMIDYCREEIVRKYGFSKVSHITAGGKERYDSVYRGLLACGSCNYVFIHDGARPFITEEILERGFEAVQKTGACAVGMPVKDTIKIADAEDFVSSTPDRRSVWAIQTPQIFDYTLIRKAHEQMHSQDMGEITDDAMMIEKAAGVKVALARGDYRNIKITTPEDLCIAEAFLG